MTRLCKWEYFWQVCLYVCVCVCEWAYFWQVCLYACVCAFVSEGTSGRCVCIVCLSVRL